MAELPDEHKFICDRLAAARISKKNAAMDLIIGSNPV
jgi:hypothetical protein